MNTTQDDGGAAYPTQTYDDYAAKNGIGVSVTDHPGMTLRDWFAGMALQGMMANPVCNAMAGQDVARNCYRMAEEMLAARKEQR